MTTASPLTQKDAIRWLFQQARQPLPWLLSSIGMGVAGGVLLIYQAHLIARIIHAAVIDPAVSLSGFTFELIALPVVVILRAASAGLREMSGFRAGARVREAVRTALGVHIFRLGPAFTGRQTSGRLSSVAMAQVEALHEFFARYLPQLALAALVPGAILAAVFPISWAAGGLLLVTAPMIPLFMVLVGMGAESVSQRHFQALARLSAQFLDVLQGLPTLKLLGRSREAADAIAASSRDYRKRTMRVLRIAFLSSAVLEFFASVSIALVAVYLGLSFLRYIGYGAYEQPLTLQQGLFILFLAPDFYMPLRELGAHYHDRAKAVAAARDIVAVLSAPPAGGIAGTGPARNGDIAFQDVQFDYGGGTPVLRGVDFRIREGDHVALVGATGEGKTTILNLILGFLAPTRGVIRIGGRRLAAFEADAWHRLIAWVGQQPMLFSGTIDDNIRMARPDATTGEVTDAADAAHVTEFTSRLPLGMETPVGEQGFGLSRGQAQRVALARAFLKPAPLLLLDEPTAGLDTANERLVLDAMAGLMKGRTVLLVTHRIAGMARADRLLVLDRGRIAESGTFEALTAVDGPLMRLLGPAARRRDS